MKTRILFGVILVMVAAMTLAPEVSAQGQGEEYTLEEITVTATKRETALEDTALALSVVTGDMMNEQGRNDVYDILKDVPGLTFGAEFEGGGVPHLNIRGISGGIIVENHGDPAVATNIDGAYSSPLIGSPIDIAFYDIARVELLRGPQGTLYGRNAEGGVLNVVTSDPSNKDESAGNIELGNYQLIRTDAMFNAVLSDNSALRIAFRYYDRDSYYTAGGGGNSVSGRVKYLYKPSDSLRLLFGGEVVKESPANLATIEAWGLGDYPTGDPYDNLTRLIPGFMGVVGDLPSRTLTTSRRTMTTKLYAQVDWETPLGTVTFLPSYSQQPSQTIGSTQRTFKPPSPSATYRMRHSIGDNHQKTFEARLASKADTAFDYVFGIFYLSAEAYSFYEDYEAGGVKIADDSLLVGQTSKAAFGQGTYHFTDKLRGSLGLRYTKDTKNYSTPNAYFGISGGTTAEKKWTRTDWKVGVEMDIFEDGLLYADVATGYRPGSANVRAASTAFDQSGNVVAYPNQFSEPEELLAYEIGAKTLFFDKRLTVNLDAYYYDYTNRQYTELQPNVPITQLCPSTGVRPSNDERLSADPDYGLCYAERNMGKVTTYGAELSTIMRPTDNDTINFSVAHLDAYVAEKQIILVGSQFNPITHTLDPVFVDANNAKMPSSPEWEVNLSYDHRFDFEQGGALFLRGDGRYESECFVQDLSYLNPNTNTLTFLDGSMHTYSYRDLYTSEAHKTYDFTATYMTSNGKYTLGAYVKNISNEYWKTRTDGMNTSITGIRTYGFTFGVRF